MWRTLPSSTSSASAPTVSSIGVFGIHPVLVVEIDVVRAQSPERSFDGGADVGRAAVEMAGATAGVRDHAELRGQHDLVTSFLDRLPDQLLVGEGPIDLGRVEQGDPEVEGTVDGPDGFGVVLPRAREGGRHAHGARARCGRRPGFRVWRASWCSSLLVFSVFAPEPDRRDEVLDRHLSTGDIGDGTGAPDWHQQAGCDRPARGSRSVSRGDAPGRFVRGRVISKNPSCSEST